MFVFVAVCLFENINIYTYGLLIDNYLNLKLLKLFHIAINIALWVGRGWGVTVSGLLCCLCRDGVTIKFFPAYILWELYQLFIKSHHHNEQEWGQECIRNKCGLSVLIVYVQLSPDIKKFSEYINKSSKTVNL